MAGQLLLVNPRKRRRKSRVTRRRRRSSSRRRKNPGFALPNPRKRRRSRRRGFARVRRRRNPSGRMRFSIGGVQSQVMNAVPGALGALGLDVLMGFVPIPAQWKTGIPGYLVKAIGAIAVGMLAGATGLAKGGTATKMTEGALTVMLHGILRNMTAQFAPMVPLGEYEQVDGLGYSGAGYDAGVGAYLPGMGDYDETAMDGLNSYDDTEGVYN